ncbi:hypothetical protein LSH36_55g00002 [Paralvinella palmiformis]|uniref:S1 motif domain-containing protein n=1 Tax=Paralvinella palmiformis TaxID=53620 RepID=A0AAD9K605_9ANNE|nr:hypothetical protein LSH36_55g00002 [Paralvinella palmiformis]
MCRMGPKVFINCAGFIKIDTSALGDSTEAYVEVLDGSRVHPETYDWARKMAVDALEYDDTAEDANPAGALEEILESPERLRDLDLDAFAVELEKQGYGNRQITLYDIRAELNHRYKDLRTPYQSPTSEEKFNMLTKETPATFHIGKLIMCAVTGIAHKRPRGEQLDEANPYRNDETGLWQCPFCQKNDFPELSEVWNHFDAGECKGQPVGVKTRLDNGVSGFIPLSALSDKRVEDPEQRVQVSMTLHCRITKIDIERYQVELTSKTSDLIDKEGKWKLQKDLYYDFEHEESDKKREADLKQKQARQTYVKRVIAHPSFHNIDYKSTIKLMTNMEPGEVVIRPSSKGTDHLTATWKVTDSILQHIDIREEGKGNAFSLGKSLWIQNEEFEDLDEIIARHIQPMAAFVRDILSYKYHKESDGGNREVMEKICIEEKKKAPSKIPYFFTASKEFPGKFMLSYLPRKTVRHEFVTVTPDGIRYRQQIFTSLNSLVKWFKEHFRDPIPGTPASMKTPMGQAGIGATPNINLQNVDVATIQRAAAGLPSSVYNSLAQVAGQTPFGGFNQFQPTPMLTPMMTPAQQQPFVTPAGIGTPMTSATGGITGQYGGHSNWQGSTPRVQPGTTPRQYAGTTPRPLPGQVTPRPGQATPRQQPGPTTPRHYSAAASPRHGTLTPRQYVGSSTPTSGQTPRQNRGAAAGVGTSASQDWGKMAKMWAKERLAAEQGGTAYDNPAIKRSRRTPRSEQSPRVATPRGDATPLFDER